MTFFLIVLSTLFAVPGGSGFEASASLDGKDVLLGRCVLFIVEATGPAAADCEVTRFPAVEGLFAERVSSRVSARKTGAGGAPLLVTRFIYRLYPLKPGAFVIPSVEVTARGRKRALTRPLELAVREGGAEGAGGAVPPADVRLAVSFRGKTSLFWHEPLFVDTVVTLPAAGEASKVRLFLPWLGRRRGVLPLDPLPLKKDAARLAIPVIQKGCEESFAVEPAAPGGGRKVRCRRTDVLIPLEEGSVAFGPAFAAVGSGTALGPVRYRLAETPSIEVRGLPAEGRPPSFTNGVGRFSLAVAVAPRRVRVGDPLSLRFTVRGKPWSLELLHLPDLPELAGSFRIFGMKEGREEGPEGLAAKWRLFELSPSSTAVRRVPPLAFSYFDPGAGRYETLTWEGVPVEVLPGEGTGPPGAKVRQAAEDIATIIEEMPSGGAWMERAALGLLSAGVLFALYGLLCGRKGLLRADPAAAERLGALDRFRREAEPLLARGAGERDPPAGGRDVLYRLLSRFVRERFGLPRGGAVAGEIGANLRRKGVEEELALEAEAFFARLEEGRFGRGGDGEEGAVEDAGLGDLFEEALGLAGRLDREAAP